MKRIGGNTEAVVEKKSNTGKNMIGEIMTVWNPVGTIKGFLDYSSGESTVNQYNSKTQDTTHMFFCDYSEIAKIDDVTSDNSRMVINNQIYNVLLIDNPMGMNQHIEMYLKYVGGGLGV